MIAFKAFKELLCCVLRFNAIEDPKSDRRDTNAVSTSDLSIKHTSRHTSERHMMLAINIPE